MQPKSTYEITESYARSCEEKATAHQAWHWGWCGMIVTRARARGLFVRQNVARRAEKSTNITAFGRKLPVHPHHDKPTATARNEFLFVHWAGCGKMHVTLALRSRCRFPGFVGPCQHFASTAPDSNASRLRMHKSKMFMKLMNLWKCFLCMCNCVCITHTHTHTLRRNMMKPLSNHDFAPEMKWERERNNGLRAASLLKCYPRARRVFFPLQMLMVVTSFLGALWNISWLALNPCWRNSTKRYAYNGNICTLC